MACHHRVQSAEIWKAEEIKYTIHGIKVKMAAQVVHLFETYIAYGFRARIV